MFNYYIESKPPKFLEGDEVEFEIVTVSGSAVPRWDTHNNDHGRKNSRPIFAKGEVTLVTPEYICVEFEVAEFIGKGQATFPYYDHKKYTSWQWGRDGYLRKIIGKRCVCGAEKCNTTHSFWCDKYDKYKKERKEIK